MAMGQSFPRSVSKSKLSPTRCPRWQPRFPSRSMRVMRIAGRAMDNSLLLFFIHIIAHNVDFVSPAS